MTNDNSLAKNRAEEFGHDLWREFVIPHYFSEFEKLNSLKPSIIVGGRGCGKTMLLRYLCHETQFSSKRDIIDKEAFSRIGLYWKIDTQFAKTMSLRNEEVEWNNAFIHMGVLILSAELLKSIESMQQSVINEDFQVIFSEIDFSSLKGFEESIPSDFFEFKKYLKNSFNIFQMWVANCKKLPPPIFFPINFLIELVEVIKGNIPFLKCSNFHVYIDEYENLLSDQKRIVNTWVKHSESPLIFNLAMKRNAFGERLTVGNEQIVGIHDYREFDLEILLDNHYDIFAAEILLFRLKQIGYSDIPINIDDLFVTDKKFIDKRKSSDYKQKILEKARQILPGYSQKEISDQVLRDSILKKRVQDLLKKALDKRNSKNDISDYYDENYSNVTIVLFALLNRKDIKEADLLKEIALLKEGKSNKFMSPTGWVHNNIVGCLLFIYSKLGRLCPIYSGYETFCKMSKGNIRHFLELCFKSIVNNEVPYDKEFYIEPMVQAAAAKQVSTSLLKEVRALGPQGNSLYTFVIRLGTIFEYCRDNPAQSEPEQNHFTIKDGISCRSQEFLDELCKWSVLYEEKLTKRKNTELGVEYILNPIYSSYFNISFRKKRRIEISDAEFGIIAFENLDTFEGLIRSKYKKGSGYMPSLFDLF